MAPAAQTLCGDYQRVLPLTARLQLGKHIHTAKNAVPVSNQIPQFWKTGDVAECPSSTHLNSTRPRVKPSSKDSKIHEYPSNGQ